MEQSEIMRIIGQIETKIDDLTDKIDGIKVDVCVKLNDHEGRLRKIEDQNTKFYAKIAVIYAIVAAVIGFVASALSNYVGSLLSNIIK